MGLRNNIIAKLNEGSYDNTNYIDLVKKFTKKWWKDNADLGIRIFKGSPEFESRKEKDGIHYFITISNFFVETEEYAEEIGKYVADHTPHTEYVGFKEIKDEDDGDGDRVIIELVQKISKFIDCGSNIY